MTFNAISRVFGGRGLQGRNFVCEAAMGRTSVTRRSTVVYAVAAASNLESLERRMMLNGLTVITNGYELDGTAPGWLFSMKDAIVAKLGSDTSVYDLQLNYNSINAAYVSSFGRIAGPAPDSAASSKSETVLLVDWAADTGIGILTPYFTTTQIANLVTPYLVNTMPSAGITTPLAEGPIQLIGHSRGGSLVSEIAKDLGQSGIWVDQVTTLDPHPVLSDPSVSLAQNVVFSDNYYQTSGDNIDVPNGSSVAGAFNLGPLSLPGAGSTHSNVHTFYYGTIDTSPSASDGDYTVPSSWYLNGYDRTTTGYYFSRIDGGTRPVSGLSSDFGGVASRATVSPSGVQWPDIGDIRYAVGSGNLVTLSYRYQNNSSSAVTVSWFQDSDNNPYNNNDITSLGTSYTVAPTGSSVVFAPITFTTIGDPTNIYAKITDGSHTRYAYADQQLTANAIISGQTVVGTLAAGDMAVYSFSASQGDSVSVAMGKTSDPSGLFVPQIDLYGPNGALLETNTNYSNAGNIDLQNLPSTGIYYAVSRANIPGEYGGYNITMAKLPGQQALGGDAGPIASGQTVSATIDKGDLDVFTLSASQGDSVSLAMSETSDPSGFFVPQLDFYGPNGVLLKTNTNYSTAANVDLQNLQSTGTYYAVARANVAGEFGGYRITMSLTLGPSSRYVTHVYEDLLGRAPDVTGLQFWVQAFASGAKTRADLASGFLNSTEYRADLIQSLYQAVLDRGADSGGLSYWLDFFSQGGTFEQMKAMFYGSDEYFGAHGSNKSGVVDAYYMAFLGRHAEASGITYWLHILAGGRTRDQVALMIESGSTEGASDIVNRTYETFLHRQPDEIGLSYWIGQLQAGKSQLDITYGFVVSDEYYQRA